MPPQDLTITAALDGSHDPVREVMAFAEDTSRLLAVVDTLVKSRRTIALEGLQGRVGLLCAKALDLPPKQTPLVRLELERLLKQINSLEGAMRDEAA